MAKTRHEVRDAIHGFILFDPIEKKLIDSEPMQRLRCIHQLAMTYQVYPGATHTRFEHSLGVMEFSGLIFDQLFRERLPDDVQSRIPQEMDKPEKDYWRKVTRIAGLLHDVGHLPFSHAAEKELLPEGWNHERITAEIIRNSEIAVALASANPPIRPEDVVDVAWDASKRSKTERDGLTPWKMLLNEIVCGDTFGADRIDYLLRDSLHAGVAYGRFDPDRLISGLTVVIDPETSEIAIGLEIGAIHAAEALLLARYFMYTQVYFHDVRRAYDLHLKEFLQAWLPDGKFSNNWEELLTISDHEVLVAAREALQSPESPLHDLAKRLLSRRHFRTVYELNPAEKKRRPTIFADLISYAREEFGEGSICFDQYGPKSETNNFPVRTDSNKIEISSRVSDVIKNVPAVEIGLIFADEDVRDEAKKGIDARLNELLNDPELLSGE